jgi:hypothetical protein
MMADAHHPQASLATGITAGDEAADFRCSHVKD